MSPYAEIVLVGLILIGALLAAAFIGIGLQILLGIGILVLAIHRRLS